MIARGTQPRRVIPRWRSPIEAFAANEGRILAESTAFPLRPDVSEREADWLNEATRGRALDLVSIAATMPDPSPTARDAASWLLEHGNPSRLARVAAERILTPTQTGSSSGPDDDDHDQVHNNIRRFRAATRADPRNAIAWAEQARNYTVIGQREPAQQAMRRALALAPHHRYFLRAGARLYVHRDENDKAHALLRDSPRTRSDPWLLAAEISIAGLANRQSPNIRTARHILQSGNWSPGHLTELASALGTLELDAGSERRARPLFRTSLYAPNDNALAQAEWAVERVRGVASRLEAARATVPRSFEARSLAAINAGTIETAVVEAWRWLLDQPFSAQPAGFGSYHAGQIGDFERSLAFAERGIRANPNAMMLRNNAAFALANLGRLDEAAKHLDRVRENGLTANERAVVTATRGLLAFRSANPVEGQAKYGEAIDLASDTTTRVLATVMLMSEMLRLHLPGSVEAAAQARKTAEKTLSHADRGWIRFLSPPPDR